MNSNIAEKIYFRTTFFIEYDNLGEIIMEGTFVFTNNTQRRLLGKSGGCEV